MVQSWKLRVVFGMVKEYGDKNHLNIFPKTKESLQISIYNLIS